MSISRFKSLPEATRRLFQTFICFAIALPLLGTFTSAFVWRHGRSELSIVFFNGGLYLGLAAGFALSGPILRKVAVNTMYAFGLVAQCLPVLILATYPAVSLLASSLAGLIFGLMGGTYWCARNLLILSCTQNRDRDYFFGLDSFVSIGCSTLLPIAFGYLIERGFFFPDSLDQRASFFVLLMLSVLFLTHGAIRIGRLNFSIAPPAHLLLNGCPPEWAPVRTLTFLCGFSIGVAAFVPTLLVLKIIGGQDNLGGVQSAAALATGGMLYYLGHRASNPGFRIKLLYASLGAGAVSAIALLIDRTPVNIVGYTIGTGLSVALLWNGTNPLFYRAIELADPARERNFAFVLDRELSLNFGRVSGTMAFGLLAHFSTFDTALIAAPVVGFAALVLILVPARTIDRHQRSG